MLYHLLQSSDAWLEEMGVYSLMQVLYQIEFRAFAAAIAAWAFVLVAGRPFINWLRRMKIGDVPEFNREALNQIMRSKAATPTMGGALIIGGILTSVLLLGDLTNRYLHLALVVMIWLGLVGGADDWLKLTTARRAPGSRDGLRPWEKLLFQLGLGFIAAVFLWRLTGDNEAARSLVLPFQRTYVPMQEGLVLEPSVIVLGFPFFVISVMLLVAFTSNAVNITDGLDGLAPGTMLIASLAVMLLCYVAGSPERAQYMLFPYVEGALELMVVTGAMAGACLGFLWFNCQPASVYMGDTGSLPLGGLLATIACAIRQEVLLLIIGGVFFFEAASVMLQVGYFKLTGGKRIFRCAPIHHHFHMGGWQENQVVVRFWILGVMLAVGALVLLKLR
ncbi:MAG: phospho-N-acetylmuramoyl-pentapeptide-transferase [Phycisphaerales bacterium]|nr:phospho-N-acetylmuramoyl-pentapeptide-transferase [Phycisphaerales bacterium]